MPSSNVALNPSTGLQRYSVSVVIICPPCRQVRCTTPPTRTTRASTWPARWWPSVAPCCSRSRVCSAAPAPRCADRRPPRNWPTPPPETADHTVKDGSTIRPTSGDGVACNAAGQSPASGGRGRHTVPDCRARQRPAEPRPASVQGQCLSPADSGRRHLFSY